MPVTRVDFYLLKSTAYSRLGAVCRIIEKAYQQGRHIQALTDVFEEAQELDKLLWTFNDRSFIAHELGVFSKNLNNALKIPVYISDLFLYQCAHQDQADAENGIIICSLIQQAPDFFLKFNRIIEIVSEQDAVSLEKARQKYRFYRDNKCELYSHIL